MIEPDGAAGFAELSRYYRKTLQICDALEAVADSLPNPDPEYCRQLAWSIRPVAEATNRLEESILFPALLGHLPEQSAEAIIARLRHEHAQDRAAAKEVARVLVTLSRGARGSGEAAGYMLRAYFLAVRRHVAAEQDLVTSLTAIQAH